jgi:hypothetical protein
MGAISQTTSYACPVNQLCKSVKLAKSSSVSPNASTCAINKPSICDRSPAGNFHKNRKTSYRMVALLRIGDRLNPSWYRRAIARSKFLGQKCARPLKILGTEVRSPDKNSWDKKSDRLTKTLSTEVRSRSSVSLGSKVGRSPYREY